MQLLSNKFLGFITVCEQCNSVLAYDKKDIYDNKYIYCIVCKHKNEVAEILDVKT